jgi:quercetin dioxygenase-like cupin family protein
MNRASLLGALVIMAGTTGRTQTPAPTTEGAPVPVATNFTGGKVVGFTVSDIRTNRYEFQPGARTRWHSHEGGQVIFIEKGSMRVQEEGKPVRDIASGVSYSVAPGTKHWHGATPTLPVRTVNWSFGVTMWSDPVSDADYDRQP